MAVGPGFQPKFPTYYKRFGFRGGVITAVDLLKGMAMHAGLDVIRVPGVTGYFDTNYVEKAEYAVNSLRSRDLSPSTWKRRTKRGIWAIRN